MILASSSRHSLSLPATVVAEQKRKGDDFLAKRETLQMVRYMSACDPDVQKHLAAMINAVAGKAT